MVVYAFAKVVLESFLLELHKLASLLKSKMNFLTTLTTILSVTKIKLLNFVLLFIIYINLDWGIDLTKGCPGSQDALSL